MTPKSEKPLSILIYGLNYAPELVGVGRYTGDIGRYLQRNGHRVCVVTAPPHYPDWRVKAPYSAWRYGTQTLAGISITRCPILIGKKMHGLWRLLAPLSFALASAPIVMWKILRHSPDVVFCVEPTLFAAPAALLAAKAVRARTILHVQDLEIDAAFAVGHLKSAAAQKLAAFFERHLLRGFDRVISISNKMRERLIAKGVAPQRISVIRNWVDLDQIQPRAGRSNLFRTALGLAEEDFVVLYSGSIGPKHALHLLLDVADRFAPEKKSIRFVIAGEGPEKPRLMARYGHLPNVQFLPLQPAEKLCELLNFADLHVLPQDKGVADLVLPSKLGGILASGKPLLVTADPGTELFEVLQGTATIVAAGDIDSMAREIAALAQGGVQPSATKNRKLAELFAEENCLQEMQAQFCKAE